MKRISQWIVALTLLIGCVFCMAMTVSAEEVIDSGTCGENLTWTLDDTGTLTISGTGPMMNYAYSSNSPTYANHPWANSASKIKNVVIEYGVTSIGDRAFYDCSNLTSVTIPDSVTSIGSCAFEYCSSLTSVTIPDSVTNIGSSAFHYCSSLKSITIPDSVTSIGSYTFYNCSRLTSIIIPDSVTSIGSYAFSYCRSLTSVTIGDSVSSIGESAFYNCSSLKYNTYDFGKYLGNKNNPYIALIGVTSIGITACEIHPQTQLIVNDAFEDCTSLNTIAIPDSVTGIGDYAFRNCSSLTSITIGDSVTGISDYAFYNCSSLTSITIGDSVTGIGDYAFYNCSSLTDIYVDPSVWCKMRFDDAYANPMNYAENMHFTDQNGKEITDLVLDNTVTSIPGSRFENCSDITSIVIPDSVESIGYNAFHGCSSLESITIPFVGNSRKTASDTYQYPFGYIFGTDSYDSGVATEQYYYGSSTSYTTSRTYYIPQSLKSVTVTGRNILYGAFYNCNSLESVTIPENVTSIGNYAFYNCNSLTGVYIFDITAWCNIDFSHFYSNPLSYAKNLYLNGELVTELVIPDSVTSIGSDAFENCSSLTSVTIPDSVTSIGSSAFSGCSSLTSVTIGDSVTNIGSSAFENCSSLKSITIPDSVTSFGNYAFENCSSLTGVYISDITSWCNIDFLSSNSNPLSYAKNLYLNGELVTELVIPDSVTNIGSSAFYYCSSLKSITIPDSVTSIGYSAFSGCSSLESITIPFVGDSHKTASDTYQYPFGYIFGTSSYDGGVATEQRYYYKTFYATNATYYIPQSLKSVTVTGGNILYGAFYNCNNLESVTIGDSVTSIGNSAFSGCSTLTSITIGDSVENIGEDAFYDCSSLESIIIPDSVTSIGSYAFSGCNSLESMTIPFVGGSRKTASDTYQYPFGYIFGTSSYDGGVATKQYYYGSSTSYTTNATYYIPQSLKSVTVTGGSILYGAFYNCGNLESVTIPDSVTSIGSSAFRGCSSLTSVTIPDSVTNIGSSAFSGCSGLRNITIPDSVTSIRSYVFYDCSSLTSITIGDSVENIGEDAFYDCSSLESIIIPDSVTSIGSSAFSGCSSLESITIPFVGDSHKTASDTYQYPFGYIFGTSSYDGGVATEQYYYGSSTSYKADATYYIPQSLKTVTITGGSILYGAFYNCSNLESITIPDSVTSIGGWAFDNCSNLTSIIIPDSVTSIGSYAFSYCCSLTSVTIGDGVNSIGDYAFDNCSSLNGVYISDITAWCNIDFSHSYSNPLYYAKNLYLNGELVTELVIPDSVTNIGSSAFYYCSSLKSITIPDSVTSIGSSAFSGCSSLESITIPFVGDSRKTASDTYQYPFGYIFGTSSYDGGVATYQHYYYSTSSTTSSTYYIPQSLKSVTVTGGNILYGAFYNCSSLTSVTIGDSVTNIGSSAFRGCSSLTSVTIGDGVNSIGDYAFYNCSSLTDVYVGPNVWCKIQFGYSANPMDYAENMHFIDQNGEEITNLVLDNSVTSIPTDCFKNCSDITSIVIPDSVTSIGSSAFYHCSSLTSITIPDSVTSIGYDAFRGCSSLKSIIIPDSVTSIGDYAFCGCSSLTGLDIPNCVTTIGYGAFSGCSSLTNITVPDSVTSIGSSAFSGCSSLESITIPFVGDSRKTASDSDQYPFGYIFGTSSYDGGVATYQHYYYSTSSTTSSTYYIPQSLKSVTITGGSILYGAFYNCGNLESVTIGDSVTGIGDSAFYWCGRLTSVTIGDSVTSIGNNAFSGCSRLTSVTIGDSVTGIEDHAFYGCSSLTSIIIPDSVTSIGDYAFRSCSSLTSVTIPDSVTSIGSYTFCNCSSLTSVTIGDGVTSIGDYAFSYCRSLTSVIIGDGVTSIGSYAFSDCSSLTSVSIGESVESIGSSAFEDCSSLTSVTIGDSVTSIGSYAFYGCSSLTSITIPDSVTSIGYGALPNHCLYKGTQEQWKSLEYYYYGTIHTGATGNEVVQKENGYGTATVCTLCNKQLSYISEVVSISVQSTPNKLQYLGKKDVLDTTGGIILIQKTDGSSVTIPMTADMVTGFDNTKAGTQTLIVTVDGKVASFDVEIVKAIVTFLNADGTLISQAEYMYGDTVQVPEDPEVPEELAGEYVFGGWDKEVLPCAGNETYTVVWRPIRSSGDFDQNDCVDNKDVEYLLWHTLFPEDYPLNQDADFDENGMTDNKDVEYLLWHTLFPEDYPLTQNAARKAEKTVLFKPSEFIVKRKITAVN